MNPAAVLLPLLASILRADAFGQVNGAVGRRQTTSVSMAGALTSDAKKTTLTDETTWRLRLLLNDVATAKGRKLDGQLFVVEGSFIEEEGYEPPQGVFQPARKLAAEEGNEGGGGTALEVTSSRWKLSEDPDDPKDGLWIWGLFKEPLYPFMLLQMETAEVALPSGEAEDTDSIPPLKLYARITHSRSDEVGVELKTANLNVRVLEQIQLPGASVDLFEEEAVGQVSFQPL